MPDPEETEREALAVLLHATHCGCKAYSGIGDEDNVYEEMADAVLAAGFRRLSESEMRRDQAEKVLCEAAAEIDTIYEPSELAPWTLADSNAAIENSGPWSDWLRARAAAIATPSPETEQENMR